MGVSVFNVLMEISEVTTGIVKLQLRKLLDEAVAVEYHNIQMFYICFIFWQPNVGANGKMLRWLHLN